LNIANLTGLEYCTDLHYRYLYLNQIGDISSLADVTNLADLYLYSNQISDISALVQNAGLNGGPD